MLKQFSAMFGENNINIENMLNKSKGNYAYTILEVEKIPDNGTIETLEKLDGVLKVRVIK